jgi:hypothetical protein
MEAWTAVLGGLGFLGIVGGMLLGFVIVLVLPLCAIIECLQSNRDTGLKAFFVIAIVATFGLGSVIYGLFLTSSRSLRIFTIFGVSVPLLILVPSVISMTTSAGWTRQLQAEKEAVEMQELIDNFNRSVATTDELEPFIAVHFAHGSLAPRAATLARFTLQGPEYATARDIDNKIRHVAHESSNDRYFALTQHDFGTITPSSGRFASVEVDPSLDSFGWPTGLALDTTENKVVVMTSHVATRFYRYDPQSSDWEQLPAEIRDLPLVGLVFSPDENCLYALEHRHRAPALRTIHRFNTHGANLGQLELKPPIPITRETAGIYQLHYSTGKLVLLVPPFEANSAQPGAEATTGNRIFVVDPASGEVSVPPDSTSGDGATS